MYFETSTFMVTLTFFLGVNQSWSWDEFNNQSTLLHGPSYDDFMVHGVNIPLKKILFDDAIVFITLSFVTIKVI